MNALSDTGVDFYVTRESLKATVLTSLLTAWVLIGVFIYLNRYTKRRYFTIWTTAWLFYVLWLVLNLAGLSSPAPSLLLIMARQWCMATVAVFLLWGTLRFMGRDAGQVLLALFLGFLLTWSYIGVYHLDHPVEARLSLFALIGLASVATAVCFADYRRKRGFIGAGLLSLGFLLWGFFVATFPLLETSKDLLTAGFFISAVLQIFIAVSMIILVLEEVRSTNQQAFERIRTQRSEKTELRIKVASTEERYRTLFDQASEAIIIAATKDLRILELNQAALRLLGINHAEAVQQFLPVFCQLSNGENQPGRENSEWVKLVCSHSRVKLIGKDGGSTPAEADGAPIDYEGEPAFQFFFREITERARLEQQLRQAEKLSALGQMISGVAHELNNPLSVIKGYLDLILAHHEVSAQTRSDLSKVTHECNRSIKLVRNFLSFAREQPARREMVNFNEMIQRVAELRRFDINTARVDLELALAPALPLSSADPDQVQQLIVNIVNNSIQAMANAPEPRRLRITTSLKTPDLLYIQIEDNGPGVPAELETRIFEPFFTTKELGKGTGLGLSIAHSILADHRGRIFYKTASLGGAGFFLEFPIIKSDSQSVPEPAVIEATHPQSSLPSEVLVLDDEPSIADLLSEMLSVLGHHPVICLTPTAALEVLEKRDFDLILSDFRMPVMNGEQFYHEVKKRKPYMAPRIIFLTGDVVNEETQSFLNSTGNPHLDKPFQLARIESVVSEVLARAVTTR